MNTAGLLSYSIKSSHMFPRTVTICNAACKSYEYFLFSIYHQCHLLRTVIIQKVIISYTYNKEVLLITDTSLDDL